MNDIQPLIDALQDKLPWLAALTSFMGLARLLAKPISALVQSFFSKLVLFIQGTPETDDDAWLERVLASKPYRFFSFVVDWVLSIKLPSSESVRKVVTSTDNSISGPLLAIGLIGIMAFTGCQSTPAKTAANISDASKITVEAALRAWNDYIPVGHPSLEQQAKVREVWRKYQTAQLLILDTAIILKQSEAAGLDNAESQQALNAAIAQATTALADLVTLLRQTGVKI